MSAGAPSQARLRTVRIWGRDYPVIPPSALDPRFHLALVIWALQVLGLTLLAFDRSIPQVLIPPIVCGVTDFAITFWRQRVIMWPASALLTGNGIAFIFLIPGTEHGDWWSFNGTWILVATSVVAVLSKHLIRFRGRHIFNPSNLALVLFFLVLGSTRTEPLFFWWGPMSVGLALGIGIIAAGALGILLRLRILSIAVSFWLTFAACLAVVAASGHSMTARWHLGPITDWSFWWVLVASPEILIFMCFMITDPKTIPRGRVAQIVYGVSIGVLAALLIAPQTPEFGHKVGVLGALVIVCAARPLLERWLPAAGAVGDRLPAWLRGIVRGGQAAPLGAGRLAAVGALSLVAIVGVGALLVAAGAPSRSSAASSVAELGPAADVPADEMPEVTVVPPEENIAAQIDEATAQQMARDMVTGLQIQAEALTDLDLGLAASGAGGAWLEEIQKQIRSGMAGAPIEVPWHHLQRMIVSLSPNEGQVGPAILVSLEGTVDRATYSGSSHALIERRDALPFNETFEVAPIGGRYLIVDSRGESAPDGQAPAAPGQLGAELSAVNGPAAAQGAPLAIELVLRNSGEKSITTTVDLALTGPDGTSVPFYRDKVFVPFSGEERIATAVTPSQWFELLGNYEVSALVEGEPIGEPLTIEVTEPTVSVPRFEDATAAAGLDTTVPAPVCGQFSNGAAWADIEGDGDLDLFLTRLGEPAQLFVNDGSGHFSDEAGNRGLAVRDAYGAAFADYDNDGDADLYVAREGSDLLLRNDGSGHFADVSAAAGIADRYQGMSASWGDFDSDGYLDLYVSNYGSCTGEWDVSSLLLVPLEYHPDLLYRNNGNGTFSDVTALLEKDPGTVDDGATTGAGFAAAWFDYNGDNRPDLYLANDFVGGSPDQNRLWRNDGKSSGGWAFTDVSTESGTGFFMNTMGIAVGDFDRDLDLDVALSNVGENKLLRNDGKGAFSDEAAALGVDRPLQQAGSLAVTWGTAFYDFNLDGWEDLYLPAGNIIQYEGAPLQPNELYVNDGAGTRFFDLSAPSGAADPGDSKGVAYADYDGDGDTDLFVVNEGGAPRLYENVTPRGGNHWLEVDTVGTRSNRDGCGAHLLVTLGDGSSMIREVFCGSTSISSGSQKAVHFGLGAATRVTGLEVLWPSGVRQELHDVEVDRMVTVTEPER